MRVHLIWPARRRWNRKLGDMPVAYVERASCAASCVLLNQGCYAEHGPVSWHWNRMQGDDWLTFCRKVAERLGPRQIWRYGVAGDLPGVGDVIDAAALDLLAAANAWRPVIAYTHKPVLDTPVAGSNRQAIAAAIDDGFLVNLSANSPAQADRLAALELAPVVTILPRAYQRTAKETIGQYRDRLAALPRTTPAGRRIAVCPATYADTTCLACRACARPRNAIIGFPAHGASWRKAELAGLVARNMPQGQSADEHLRDIL